MVHKVVGAADVRTVLLKTERLVVRRFAPADVSALHAYRNDPEVARWQGWSVPYPHEDAARLAAAMSVAELFRPGAWTQLAVERRLTPGLIGDLGVRVETRLPAAELGFTFARSVWHNGYATEATVAVVDHLLTQRGFAQVTASTLTGNRPAQRLLERVGFVVQRTEGDEITYLRLADSADSARPDPDL